MLKNKARNYVIGGECGSDQVGSGDMVRTICGGEGDEDALIGRGRGMTTRGTDQRGASTREKQPMRRRAVWEG